MMTKIVNITKEHPLIGLFIRIGCWVALAILALIDELRGYLRAWGICSFENKKIIQLKGKYDGKRCFIICTGPSLTITDLELLKNEYTFGMNSINLIYDQTNFRSTFYGCIDKGVYDRIKHMINKYSDIHDKVFISNRIRRSIAGNLKNNWYNISCNVAYHTYDRWFKSKFWSKFSDDAYIGTYDMFSVTHFLIQIAVYMGFNKIYLLGADCSFPKKGKIHFAEHGVVDTTIDTASERNICGYKEVKKYADSHGVKIFNATRGGELEVFERVNLNKVLFSNNINK